MSATCLMKIFCTTFLLFHTFTWLNHVEAFSEVMEQDLQDCQEENNVSDSDMEQLKKKEIPDSRSAQCFLACMMGKVEMIDGGRLNPAGAKGMISQMEKIDSDDREKLMACVDECEESLTYDGDDECVNAVKISMCISDKAQEKGVKTPE